LNRRRFLKVIGMTVGSCVMAPLLPTSLPEEGSLWFIEGAPQYFRHGHWWRISEENSIAALHWLIARDLPPHRVDHTAFADVAISLEYDFRDKEGRRTDKSCRT
jgi:hypothetical protein